MSETAKVTTYWWLPIQEQQNGFLIKFYANHEAVENPVFKLYDKDIDPPVEEFKVLAENFPGIWKEIKGAGVDTSPPRESLKFVHLRDGGQLRELKVPLEFIVGLNKNGNPNKRALWPETLALWAGQPASGAGEAGEQRVYRGFTEQHEDVLDLVGREVYEIAKSAVLTTDELYDEIEDSESGIQLNPTPDELLKMVFYQTSRTFDKVRGAMTLSFDKARQGMPDDFQIIRDGELKDFSQDLADGHYLIDDRDEARAILETIGIRIAKDTLAEYEEVDRRLEVAEQVWLFADITKKYKKTPGQAVETINGLFNEIPW
jgi:hypothetical protein